jgi:hypothetical protein
MTREIFNNCAGNQMRDVFIKDVEVSDDDFDALVKPYLTGGEVSCERGDDGGAVVFDIVTDGMRQRISFG